MEIKVKRVYEAPEKSDGFRVLVDRLWPRGLSKEKAALGLWFKEIAPSSELRKTFHQNGDFAAFVKLYHEELKNNQNIVDDFIREIKKEPVVSFLYASHDSEHNQAKVLREFILKTI